MAFDPPTRRADAESRRVPRGWSIPPRRWPRGRIRVPDGIAPHQPSIERLQHIGRRGHIPLSPSRATDRGRLDTDTVIYHTAEASALVIVAGLAEEVNR